VIVRENDNRLDELEVSMLENFEPVHCLTTHRFTDGMYIREIFMPAGSLITSKIHNTEHPYIVSYGKTAVSIDGDEWNEITAPYTGITQPGTRRVLYIIEDCIWTTFHRIDGMKSEYNNLSEEEIEKIVEGIEEKILEPHINYLTGTDIKKEYLNALEETKKIEVWPSSH
jgi:hypothetical protein